METIVRIKDIYIKNIKNVKGGILSTNTTFYSMKESDIVGLYGQNGSGKTAIVEAMKILKTLINEDKLPDKNKYLISHGEDNLEISCSFFILNKYGEYIVKYNVVLENNKEDILTVVKEKIEYKENEPRKKFKIILLKEKDSILVRNISLNSMNTDDKLKTMVVNKFATLNNTGFIFSKELSVMLKKFLNDVEYEIINNIKYDFNKNFHIIDNFENGLIVANIIIPFSFQLKNSRGKIPYDLSKPMVFSEYAFFEIRKVIEQINIVISTIIPGLQIIVKDINKETLENSEQGIRFEFLSEKEGVILPLRCESDGTLKLISILSTLIAVFNNPNSCVVIDELDSSIFEYLLGEILEVIDTSGKGQLFFTSHNLRILEVLDNKSIWFTTMNEYNRYIQMKGVRQTNNLRDFYIRAIQLGGQDESLYKETDQFNIKKSFRIAGNINV